MHSRLYGDRCQSSKQAKVAVIGPHTVTVIKPLLHVPRNVADLFAEFAVPVI